MGKGCLLNQLKAKYLKATNPGGAANFESEYLGCCIGFYQKYGRTEREFKLESNNLCKYD